MEAHFGDATAQVSICLGVTAPKVIGSSSCTWMESFCWLVSILSGVIQGSVSSVQEK